MLAKEQAQGIVLAKTDRGEADRTFVVFTKERGKMHIVAKGERKLLSKLRRGIDLFYLTRLTFIESPKRITLTDVDLINSFSEIRHDWRKFEIAMRISILLQKILPLQGKDEFVYRLTKEVLMDLRKSKKYFQRYYYYFFWRLINILGYQPNFLANLDQDVFVSAIEGIVSRKNSSTNVIIFPETRKLLHLIFQQEKSKFYLSEVTPKIQANLAKVSEIYLHFLDFSKDGDSPNFRL